MSSEYERKIEKLSDIIKDSNHTVFLGGAGVSTESGIPDFRGENGLYTSKKFKGYFPEYLLSVDCLNDNPELFFEYYRNNMDVRGIKPNIAHYKLAEMEKDGSLAGVITQNVDGLHQKAGSKNVHEIHGSVWINHCMTCGSEYGENYVFDSCAAIPVCSKCGNIVRPDVVLYGESLSELAWNKAILMINNADTLIIGGTTLMVGSAMHLFKLFNGKHLIVINKTPLEIEANAEVIFHESIGKVLGDI